MSFEKIFALIIIPISLVGFFVFLIISGPKKIDYSSPETYRNTLEIPDDIEAMRLKSFESEGQFEELVSLGRGTREDATLLLEAIEFQESYVGGLPFYSQSAEQRLSYLKQRYDQVLAEEVYQKSLGEEILSQNLYNNGDFLGAIGALENAIASQKEINESYVLSTMFDVNRMAKLNRRLAYLNAYPIFQEVLDHEKEVEALKNEGKWTAAADLLKKVIKKQRYLNTEYRSSDLADGLKLNAMKFSEIKYRSTPLFQQINELENKADALVETGEHSAAAAFYEEATQLQDELNESFPDSPYSVVDRLNELRRKNQTSASYTLGEFINSLNFEIDNDLRNRKLLLAKDKILRISDALQRMDEEFSFSSYNNDNIKLKINFLKHNRKDNENNQDRIYND